jgi:hypothetical protein
LFTVSRVDCFGVTNSAKILELLIVLGYGGYELQMVVLGQEGNTSDSGIRSLADYFVKIRAAVDAERAWGNQIQIKILVPAKFSDSVMGAPLRDHGAPMINVNGITVLPTPLRAWGCRLRNDSEEEEEPKWSSEVVLLNSLLDKAICLENELSELLPADAAASVQNDLRSFLYQVVASRDEPTNRDLHAGLDDLVFRILGHLRSLVSHQPGAVPTSADILTCRRRLLDLANEIESWWSGQPSAQAHQGAPSNSSRSAGKESARDLLEMKAQLGLYNQGQPAPPPGPSPVEKLEPPVEKVDKVEKMEKVDPPEASPPTAGDVSPIEDPPVVGHAEAPKPPGRPETPEGDPPGQVPATRPLLPIQLPGMPEMQ